MHLASSDFWETCVGLRIGTLTHAYLSGVDRAWRAVRSLLLCNRNRAGDSGSALLGTLQHWIAGGASAGTCKLI